jgi:hypothetical protein
MKHQLVFTSHQQNGKPIDGAISRRQIDEAMVQRKRIFVTIVSFYVWPWSQLGCQVLPRFAKKGKRLPAIK